MDQTVESINMDQTVEFIKIHYGSTVKSINNIMDQTMKSINIMDQTMKSINIMDQTMVSINIKDQTMESINIIKLFNWEKFLKMHYPTWRRFNCRICLQSLN